MLPLGVERAATPAQAQIEEPEGDQRDQARRGHPRAGQSPLARGQRGEDRQAHDRQAQADQVREVSADQEHRQDRGPPDPRPLAALPPDAERDREEARPQQEAGEPEQPGHIQREQGRQEGGQRHPPPARDSQAKPGDRGREAHQRDREDHPVRLPRRQDRDQAHRRQVPRPVRQGFPPHCVEGAEGRIRAQRAFEDVRVVEVGRPVLRHEQGDSPDRGERGGQGEDEDSDPPATRPDGEGLGRGGRFACQEGRCPGRDQPGPPVSSRTRGAGLGCVTTGLTTVHRPPIVTSGEARGEVGSQPPMCGKVLNHAALTDVGQHGPTWRS